MISLFLLFLWAGSSGHIERGGIGGTASSEKIRFEKSSIAHISISSFVFELNNSFNLKGWSRGSRRWVMVLSFGVGLLKSLFDCSGISVGCGCILGFVFFVWVLGGWFGRFFSALFMLFMFGATSGGLGRLGVFYTFLFLVFFLCLELGCVVWLGFRSFFCRLCRLEFPANCAYKAPLEVGSRRVFFFLTRPTFVKKGSSKSWYWCF